MVNVTISLDDALLARVRAEAAKEQRSVSRWIARELSDMLEQRDRQAAASERIDRLMADFPGLPLSENGKITLDRDEIYDERFRRFDHAPVQPGRERAGEAGEVPGVAEGSTADEGTGC